MDNVYMVGPNICQNFMAIMVNVDRVSLDICQNVMAMNDNVNMVVKKYVLTKLPP